MDSNIRLLGIIPAGFAICVQIEHLARSTLYLCAPEHPQNAEAKFEGGLLPMSTKMIRSANYVHSYEWDVSEAL